MDKTQWIFAYASTIGNGHIVENLPCQDSCLVQSYETCTVAILCDGAGSCSNSHFGSKSTTDFCAFRFSDLIKRHGWSASNIPSNEVWCKEAIAALRRVKDDLENFSIEKSYEYKSLSCTVIVVISFDNYLLLTHIGDGRAGYCDSNFEWQPMMVPFHGEEANQTVFITSDIWDDPNLTDTFIQSKIIKDDILAYCLMSDGCEKSAFECNLYDPEKKHFYDPNRPYPQFFNNNVKILMNLAKEGKTQEEINMLWAKFLTEGNDKLRAETDDKTLILGVRY